jgi:SAM-dependent methyltransferase
MGKNRWKDAQGAEKKYWGKYTPEHVKYQKGWFFGELTLSQGFGLQNLSVFLGKTVVEIGCGPCGFISIVGGHKIGLDPLIDFFQENGLLAPEDSETNYIKSVGEAIPISNEKADIVICYNVLDHVKNPLSVLQEINRILKIGGLFIFQVNAYSWLHYMMRNAQEKIGRGDEAHPFSFTSVGIRKLLRQHGFDIVRGSIRIPINGEDARGRFKRKRTLLFGVVGNLILNFLPFDPFGFSEFKALCRKQAQI